MSDKMTIEKVAQAKTAKTAADRLAELFRERYPEMANDIQRLDHCAYDGGSCECVCWEGGVYEWAVGVTDRLIGLGCTVDMECGFSFSVNFYDDATRARRAANRAAIENGYGRD